MKIAPFIVALLLMISCVDKNLQLSNDRLLVGDWILTSMVHGDESVNEIPSETLYQFTADRQLVIKQEGSRNVAKYVFKDNIILVDDGPVTQIREQLIVTKLDKVTLVISFKIDGFPTTMTFRRKTTT